MNLKKQEGVTLIALVITIFVILLIVGTSVGTIVSEKGLLKSSQEAQKVQQNEAEKEEQKTNDLIDRVGELPQIGSSEKGKMQTANKLEYTDETGTAIIPGGFCVVKDSTTDINTVEDGLVISDVADDDLDNSKHGNQFVWIPVSDYSKFHLIEGYYNGSLDTMLSAASNPAREAGDTTEVGSPGLPNTANSTAGSTESIAMYKSVKDNGGFYIARFEAGIAGTTTSTTTNDTNKQTQDGTVKPVSQKGVGVWNFIPWGGTSSDTASDNLAGDDNANGAVLVARSMYQKDGKPDGVHKVTSTLCYGVQWDAALNFIDSNYESGTSTGYVKDSTGKGNYSKSIATTGSDTAYQQKHIYDMAGNVCEWTMEAVDIFKRVYRGGDYNFSGGLWPASYRGYSSPNDSYYYDSEGVNRIGRGFRPALYL